MYLIIIGRYHHVVCNHEKLLYAARGREERGTSTYLTVYLHDS
jgi:hypothetical protein